MARGRVDTGPCLAILKLQRTEGVNLERVGASGAETYSLEHLRRLMLTNDTKVFKVALFDSENVVEPDDVRALVSDKQRFSSPEKRMADFFLKTFLGCRLRDDPAQVTSAYYVAAEAYINEKVADPERFKGRKLGLVLSGGNIEWPGLMELIGNVPALEF